jgi:hypothetical protein
MCERTSVKMHRRSLSLAVKLSVIRHIEAEEQQFDVCNMLDVVGSTV